MHAWVETSGTTDTCKRCGVVRYSCRCCPNGYSGWDAKAKRWRQHGDRMTKAAPACDPTRPAPAWLRERD